MGMHREFRSFVGSVNNLRFIDFHGAVGRGPACRPAPPAPGKMLRIVTIIKRPHATECDRRRSRWGSRQGSALHAGRRQ
jgi:hypothetical protein